MGRGVCIAAFLRRQGLVFSVRIQCAIFELRLSLCTTFWNTWYIILPVHYIMRLLRSSQSTACLGKHCVYCAVGARVS